MSYSETSAGSMASRGYMKLKPGSNDSSRLQSQLIYRYYSPPTVSLDFLIPCNADLLNDFFLFWTCCLEYQSLSPFLSQPKLLIQIRSTPLYW